MKTKIIDIFFYLLSFIIFCIILFNNPMPSEIWGIIASVILSALTGLGVFWGKFSSAQTEIKNLKDKVGELEKRLNEACERLAKEEGRGERDRAHDELVKKESPLSLTDKGKALLLDSGGENYVKTNKDKLIKTIKDKKPTSAYDVQEFAKQVIAEMSTTTEFIPIKDYLYKQGLDLERATTVLGIYLRDMALSDLGFTREDVDKSDPKKK